MARSTRYCRLETRSARAKLAARHEPYWRSIGQGLHLGYRKGKRATKWIARVYANKKYIKHVLGKADDHQDPNNFDVLTYFQAQSKARNFAQELTRQKGGIPTKPYTVADAIQDYLAWYAAHRQSVRIARGNCETHILPALRLVSELTAREIRQWHENLVKCPLRRGRRPISEGQPLPLDDPEVQRRRKATANRVLTILKAALNMAWREGYVPSDDAWRRVKRFRNVDVPRIRHLNHAECERLLNACEPDFRRLVKAALLTGCRYGELTARRVSDYHADSGTVLIRTSKNGRGRHVPLNEEGQRFFERLAAGRTGEEILLLRADGEPWRTSQQARRLRDACQVAKIVPAISFHVLRHTYGSILAMRGVSLQVIAEALGHADTRMTSRHYAHLVPSYVADTIRAKLPAFGVEERDNVTALQR
jgi:integrase